jgi:polyisoprenoid-binding protein YceI
MKRHWKKIVIGLAAVVVLVIGGSLIYAKVINKAPAKLTNVDLVTALDAPVEGSTPTSTPGKAPNDVTGVWHALSSSIVRYRVHETINGIGSTAVGGTNKVDGSITIDGTKVRAAGFTIDMASISSDESRRDGQFRGRVMDVNSFPTAKFVITQPIDLGSIPAEGEGVSKNATGQLTLRGITKTVTFDVLAMRKNGKIGIFGNIPVTFADYAIPNPSFGTIRTDDNGVLEFIVVLAR